MKLTHTQNMKASKSGMTLLELTVVILVLLSLISILFIGARAWKKGSDRAASILQIRNTQQAVRSFSNMNGRNPGDTVAAAPANVVTGAPAVLALDAEIFGAGKFIENDPRGTGRHPAGGTFVFATAAPTVIPVVGALYMRTTGGTAPDDFNPSAHADW